MVAMDFFRMTGDFYQQILRDAFHAKGLHECLICLIDIDQDFEHDFRAYPVTNYVGYSQYLDAKKKSMSGFICERCYSEKIKEEEKNENN